MIDKTYELPTADIKYEEEKKALDEKLIETLDELLQSAGIDPANMQPVTLEVQQQAPETNAALTFHLYLKVGGTTVQLKSPVIVTFTLPGNYVHKAGYLLKHIKDDGTTEWLTFAYDKAANTATVRIDSFSSFSIMEKPATPPVTPATPSHSGGSGGGGGSSSTAASTAGKWIQDATGWWYQYSNQSYPKDGWFQLEYMKVNEWYYFDPNGYMATGWFNWNGNWYYLNPISDGTKGKMLTGWQLIDGKWYYLNEVSDGTKGRRLTDT